MRIYKMVEIYFYSFFQNYYYLFFTVYSAVSWALGCAVACVACSSRGVVGTLKFRKVWVGRLTAGILSARGYPSFTLSSSKARLTKTSLSRVGERQANATILTVVWRTLFRSRSLLEISKAWPIVVCNIRKYSKWNIRAVDQYILPLNSEYNLKFLAICCVQKVILLSLSIDIKVYWNEIVVIKLYVPICKALKPFIGIITI